VGEDGFGGLEAEEGEVVELAGWEEGG